MTTLQQVIDSARVDLNDSAGTRYTTAQLLEYANDGIQEGYRYRPDFRVGSYSTAVPTYVASDTVPFPAAYRMLLKHYVCFRAQMREDEASFEGRAAAFLLRFEKELKK